MKRNIKAIVTITVLAVFGVSTIAFAGWGHGSGNWGHMMGSGMGPGMGNNWHQGGGNYGNLSQDEIAKLEQQRAAFFQTTENTRQQLYEKNLALQSELAKQEPDTKKASRLQSEISKLQTDLDQKRLEYEIMARKSAPNYNRGYRGQGPMMGYGPRGGGYCGGW